MAYITGEATNHFNLLEILRSFLTTNAALVAAGQEWTQVGGETGTIAHDTFVSLRGPGLSGADQIFASIYAYSNAPAAHHILGLRGHTAYNPAAPSYDPPGLSSPWVYAPLVNATIRYWIVANGRRFIMVAKSNNRYDVMYAGLVLPDHLPSDWPYPLLVGASSDRYMANSEDRSTHQNFWRGSSTGYLFTPEQLFRPLVNTNDPNVTSNNGAETAPINGSMFAVDWKNNIGIAATAQTLDGLPWIRRGRIAQFAIDEVNARNFLGHFDGLFYVPSTGAVVEGIIEYDGKDYLVVPNVYRNSIGQCAAVCLE